MQVDNAYWLWTFQGRLLQKNNKDRFCQLLWRPRPPTLLSQDQIKVWGPGVKETWKPLFHHCCWGGNEWEMGT